jgi:hypothetical protein
MMIRFGLAGFGALPRTSVSFRMENVMITRREYLKFSLALGQGRQFDSVYMSHTPKGHEKTCCALYLHPVLKSAGRW